ncbi:unnamed protein product [Phaedon cochleariae]|uniref:Uncharacterized protein n=1 Tax=Phaedon cochleariae TaxID=80249 RepID=A0A9P0GSA3_PHACE|nr:unnamed protein product [Phaedon cochleariae]
MKRDRFILPYIIFNILLFVSVNGYQVTLKGDGPIVAGATINFVVTIQDGNDLATGTLFKYDWEDSGIPQHTKQSENQNATDSWSITYNASIYPVGPYLTQVAVKKCVIYETFCYQIGSARIFFDITGTLNGKLNLQQMNLTRPDHYVSSKETVTHIVEFKKSDKEYISKAPTVLTYWFVDCTYYGITTDFAFPFNYTTPDESHIVEALVMADFTPLPPSTTVPPSTTTTKTTTTTTTKSTTTTSTLKPTTIKPNVTTSSPKITTIGSNSTTTAIKTVIKRSMANNFSQKVVSKIKVPVNGNLAPYNGSFPFVCNGSQVPTDPLKSYGYFSKSVNVKAPLSKVNVTGNNWIQPGDLLSLKISCSGSKNIEYCVEYHRGQYNVTGNESCYVYEQLDSCDFSIQRFLSLPKNTIVIIIKNDVSKVVTPVTVNIYKVKKQSQLSVIVVPVSFCLVAVVMIVFGVAYYIQNRSRFIIEVADFNFGHHYSDMEYKTFRERLRDSIVNAFSRGPTPSTSEVPVWPPGQKYGNMT